MNNNSVHLRSSARDSSKTTLRDYESETHRDFKTGWIEDNTAIMVIHGIGHQKQNETLDLFARGVLEKYQLLCGEKLRVSHRIEIADKKGTTSFQNVIRISHPHAPHYIDITEYYWAYCTEDKASLTEINAWLHGVVQGARKFYERNRQLGEKYGDSSPFFRNGKFVAWKYDLFLNFFAKLYLLLNFIVTLSLKLVSFIPFIGGPAESLLKKYMDKAVYKLTNLLGDIVIYNVTDEKSKFYCVRVEILDGAVSALKSIIEKTENGSPAYPSVIVAGHSLGSQIAYDTLNRINLLANLGRIRNYKSDGTLKHPEGETPTPGNKNISHQIKGLITFGSPLDKIVFFLRENIPDHQYLRQQITDSYNCFKQRPWTIKTFEDDQRISTSVKRLLDDIPWYNYYDSHDMISGGLDYFTNVRNVDCVLNSSTQFKGHKSRFTHGHYWNCRNFYEDIIRNFLARRTDQPVFQEKILAQAN